MSPISRETVVNKPLAGNEMKELLRADFDRMIDGEGLLSAHIAYGRVAWRMMLYLDLDNASAPTRIPSRMESARQANDAVKERPQLAAVEAFPLASPPPSSDRVVAGVELDRTITSPNEERLRAGLPLSVTVPQQDGMRVTEQVQYPPQPDLGPGAVIVKDISAKARVELRVPDPPPPPPADDQADTVKVDDTADPPKV